MTASRGAAAAYQKRRGFLVGQGRWLYPVPIGGVAAHIAALRAAGMTLRQLSTLTGIDAKHLSAIGRGQYRRVTAATSGKILAVKADAARPPSGRRDATGTRRRLQALAVAGWPAARLAPRTGLTADTLVRIRRGDYATVTGATASAVGRTFRELWNTPPPQRTAYERRAAAGAAEGAIRMGWAPAAAWGDIDDPAARPLGVRRELRRAGPQLLPASSRSRALRARQGDRRLSEPLAG